MGPVLVLKIRMKFLVIVALLFVANANGKDLQTRQPTENLSGNDGNENLGEIDLGLLGSDRIQELVDEIEEENSKLQSLKNEMERAGNGFLNMFKRTYDMIEEEKIESDLANKGRELTNAIKETYDEDAIKKMHLNLFEK